LDGNDQSTSDRVSNGYDALADKAETDLLPEASLWGDSYFQQHYSWPATRAVIPDSGVGQVLLAGCGRGDHIDWFHERGASVTGIDNSETAIQQARNRFDRIASLHRVDLTEPLGFAADDTFDLVFSNLVLSHIEEWRPVFEEFHRILTATGTLVVTTIHPLYLRSTHDVENYYKTEQITNPWPAAEIPTFYRPMNEIIGPFLSAGFSLEIVSEPTPEKSYEQYSPERYQNAIENPELIVVRASCG
jgi:SAM-dependent methyltransferase